MALRTLLERTLTSGRATELAERTLEALLTKPCAACEAPAGRAVFCPPCAETLEPPPPDAQVLAAFAYGGALADAVRQAKFHPDESRGRALVPAFREALLRRREDLPEVDLVTFVPLHWRRRLSRGFDLPALLARSAAALLERPLVEALRCTRLDPPLSLAADAGRRRSAVSGRYRARPGVVAGARLLLVDDVVTTGATLGEVSRVLLEAGAASVTPLALAATPGPGEQPEGGQRKPERFRGAV